MKSALIGFAQICFRLHMPIGHVSFVLRRPSTPLLFDKTEADEESYEENKARKSGADADADFCSSGQARRGSFRRCG